MLVRATAALLAVAQHRLLLGLDVGCFLSLTCTFTVRARHVLDSSLLHKISKLDVEICSMVWSATFASLHEVLSVRVRDENLLAAIYPE